MEQPYCLYCQNIPRCRALSDSHGELVPERLIVAGAERACEGWAPMGPREQRVRERTFQISGIGCYRALHSLPPRDQSAEPLRRKESQEQAMKDETPDFMGMIYEGMTVSQREEQLRCETDENGEFVYEDDGTGEMVRRPRAEYHLRHYATDPEGPVRMVQREGLFESLEKILKVILKAEVTSGLIIKNPKATKGNTTKSKTAKSKAAAPKKETKDMGKIVTNRGAGRRVGTPAAAPAGLPATGPTPRAAVIPGKAAAPPRKGAPVPQQAAPAHVEHAPAALPVSDMLTLADYKESYGALKQMVQGNYNEVMARLQHLEVTLLKAITFHYDAGCRTGGSYMYQVANEQGEPLFDEEGNPIMETLPELSDDGNLILAYDPDLQAAETEEVAGE